MRTSAQATELLLAESRNAQANPKEVYGFATYGPLWPRLTKMRAGLQPYNLDVLASRPKVGKSMLAASWIPPIAEQAMPEDCVVRVITLETRYLSYQRRMAAIMAEIVDPMRIRQGLLTAGEVEQYEWAQRHIGALPIEYLAVDEDLSEEASVIPGNSSVTIDDIERFVVADGKAPTFWWVLDHIGLVSDLASSDMTATIYRLANRLADLAHQHVGGMVITHLNRASVGRPLSIESIAGSDQLGRNADFILLLQRPWFEFPGQLTVEQKELIERGEVAFLQTYSRDEGGGLDTLFWDKRKAFFKEWEVPPDHPLLLPKTKK